MAFTTNQLISESYYMSDVVGRDLETVEGVQINEGLRWLNQLLAKKTLDKTMIPYETTYNFTASKGVEVYFIEDLIKVNTLTFEKDSLRYSMIEQGRNQYFGRPRVQNLESLPGTWYLERQKGGANLYIYFLPLEDYEFELHGIFRLSSIALGQDLELTLDIFYIDFLTYELTDKICQKYGMDTPANVKRELESYQSLIDKQSRPLDLTLTKVSTLGKSLDDNYWAQVNLGRGWLPSNGW